MPIRPRKTKQQKLAAWERRYQKNFEIFAKNIPDSIGSIVSPEGQSASRKARLKTNKEMGYTERSVMPGRN